MINRNDNYPRKSESFLNGMDLFFFNNEVNFYVEDIDQEQFYHEILKTLFPKLMIEKIFPLGGKDAVIKKARDAPTLLGSTKCICIVDKDFDDLTKTKVKLPNLFYLDKFCIENFLLESDALYRFIVGEKPKLKPIEINNKIDIDNFHKETALELRELFILFLVKEIAGITSVQSTGKKVFTFLDETLRLSKTKVDTFKNELEQDYIKKGTQTKFRNHITNARRKLVSDNFEKHISGKYILSLYQRKINKEFHIQCHDNSLKMRLAQTCKFLSLTPLKRKIIHYLY